MNVSMDLAFLRARQNFILFRCWLCLVGGFKHGFYDFIWDVIPTPTDELHDFSRWLLHHQPVVHLCTPWIPETNRWVARKERIAGLRHGLRNVLSLGHPKCQQAKCQKTRLLRKPVNSMVFPTWWQEEWLFHIVSYCFILFGISGTEYFSKRRREISIFKFSLPKFLGNAIQAVRTNGVEGPVHSSQIWILFTHCRNWRECHSDIIWILRAAGQNFGIRTFFNCDFRFFTLDQKFQYDLCC